MQSTRDLQNKGPTQTETEGLGKHFKQMDRKKKKAGVGILISDFKIKAIKTDPERYFRILYGGVHQENINDSGWCCSVG